MKFLLKTSADVTKTHFIYNDRVTETVTPRESIEQGMVDDLVVAYEDWLTEGTVSISINGIPNGLTKTDNGWEVSADVTANDIEAAIAAKTGQASLSASVEARAEMQTLKPMKLAENVGYDDIMDVIGASAAVEEPVEIPKDKNFSFVLEVGDDFRAIMADKGIAEKDVVTEMFKAYADNRFDANLRYGDTVTVKNGKLYIEKPDANV